MAENICKNCGAELLSGAKFCSKCRTSVSSEAPVSAEEKTCTSCGAAMLPGAKFCSKCRTPVNASGAQRQQSPFAVFKGIVMPEEASKGAVIRNVIIGAVCLILLILSIIIIPGRIRDARDVEEQDEFIVAEDTLTPEQEAEYERINSAVDAGEYENYEPETDPVEMDYYEYDYGYYEWMNREDGAEEEAD